MNTKNKTSIHRRGFIGMISAGAFTLFTSPLTSAVNPAASWAEAEDPDSWFNKIHGKHRIVFDVTEPKDIFPFAWPAVFLVTNQSTGTDPKDCSVVVILRHESIPFAMQPALWEKYHLGEAFKYNDPKTGQPSVRNPYWKPDPNDFILPGLGPVPIGINDLQQQGVMFCVCNMAIKVYSAAVAQGMNMDPETVRKDFLDNVLPGIEVVPSGVWAVGRAQEHGCAYCRV
ncbi:hypothetical protein BXY57_1730 [Thermoflavifilum aggregans]|uniref:Secreted protein n=1 Tax=Thermoflavifilum aggregans TaxID=454188 RepID=A0A2M9CW43_9BACT|nr:hypothetical protein [Thermoflavifilum aggregans]PJJ76126.1 hypothetical protein BXY57_1730 [Thermoflavifilum aggregans]